MLCFTFNSCLSCFITGHLLNIYLNECEINAELKPRYIKKKKMAKKLSKLKAMEADQLADSVFFFTCFTIALTNEL